MKVWPAASVLLMLLVVLIAAGCGNDSDDGTEAAARANAAREAALDRKEGRLREELRVTRSKVKAQEARKREGSAESEAAAGSAASSTSFERTAAGLSGEVGAVIGPPGAKAASFGSLQSGSAWSTSKVPIALRVLEDEGGPGGISSTQAEQMRAALTLSDNEAAAALFADLEHSHGGIGGASAAVTEVLREGGDAITQISTHGRGEFSSYGQTEWSLVNQQRFMSSLAAGCVAGPETTDYVLDLMGEVSSDTWGLGSTGLPARWKGGWGPGTDGGYLVRQMGILYVGDKEAVVALAAQPTDGSLESGEAMATTVAQWLAEQAPEYAQMPSGC